MRNTVVIVILAVASVGLAIALFATKKQASDQHTADLTTINDFSNQVVTANEQIKELGQVNLTLSNDLAVSEEKLASTTDAMAQLSNSLAAANSTLADTKSSLAGAEQLVTNLNTRIADLEAQNKMLDHQAETLSNSLARLTAQIEETKNQLAIAETNATFLQGELQKQLAQKAELEHKFNDLDELRAQVKRMKDEMFIARRLQMMKNDNGNKKGGQMLMSHKTPTSGPAPGKQPASTYDLNVEIGSDGSVKVIPPMGTNSPAH